jgi:hypothetical protein
MPDETTPKKLELVEDLDEEEQEFRRLRRDLPGVKGVGESGLLTISVGRQPPRNEFFRTHATFRPIVPTVTNEVRMDKQFIAVAPNMIEPLHSIGISVRDHVLYLITTPRGSLRIIPVAGPNAEGEMNEWDRTKEQSLIDGIEEWVRMYPDRENNAYKSFPAPKDRFGDPIWPNIGHARIFRMGFRDRGWLIDSTEHILVQKWAGRDRDKK